MKATFKLLALLTVCWNVSTAAHADDPFGYHRIPSGTPVGLVLDTELKSGATSTGSLVEFSTVSPIYGDDHTLLAPIGSRAYGVVTLSTKHKILGRAGKLQFTCDYFIAPDGTRVRLTGTNNYSSGANATSAVAAVTFLVNPLGLLIEGGDTVFHRGTPIEMWTAGSISLKASNVSEAPTTTFVLKDKGTAPIVGTVNSFDGLTYDVTTYSGEQKLNVDQIKFISQPAR